MGFSITTLLVIAVIVLVILVGARGYLRKTRRENVPPPPTRTIPPQRMPVAKNRFRAVSIAAPDNACAGAKALAGKRFLVAENNVPALPMDDCDAANCACDPALSGIRMTF